MKVFRDPVPGLVAPPGAVGHDRRLRRRPRRSPRGDRAGARAGRRAGPRRPRWSPSTATRPASCGPSRRPSCCCRSRADGSSCSTRRASTPRSCSRFDEPRSKEPAEDFVREVLVGALAAPCASWSATTSTSATSARATWPCCARMGAELGFDVVGLDLVGTDHRPAAEAERVSSTAIRAALAAGDLDVGHPMLGRPHEVRGRSSHGDGRARELGFRTANVAVPDDICLPADGIYAGWYLRPDGVARPAALSLGRRPTFYEDAATSLLEAHLLDFEGDLYGEPARVPLRRAAARRAASSTRSTRWWPRSAVTATRRPRSWARSSRAPPNRSREGRRSGRGRDNLGENARIHHSACRSNHHVRRDHTGR